MLIIARIASQTFVVVKSFIEISSSGRHPRGTRRHSAHGAAGLHTRVVVVHPLTCHPAASRKAEFPPFRLMPAQAALKRQPVGFEMQKAEVSIHAAPHASKLSRGR